MKSLPQHRSYLISKIEFANPSDDGPVDLRDEPPAKGGKGSVKNKKEAAKKQQSQQEGKGGKEG